MQRSPRMPAAAPEAYCRTGPVASRLNRRACNMDRYSLHTCESGAPRYSEEGDRHDIPDLPQSKAGSSS